MSEPTRSQWLAIVKKSVYLPQDGGAYKGRFISVNELRKLLTGKPKKERK